MQMIMCWFGLEEDKILLEYICQVSGVEGVVGVFYDVVVGEVWLVDKIECLVGQVYVVGLKMEVIESVNIYDDIKIGLFICECYIVNYQQIICNFVCFGVKVICYNFMLVFDWMKMDMNYVLLDGLLMMVFEKKDIDKWLEDVVKEVFENLNGFVLLGWELEWLVEVQILFVKYSVVDDQKLWENLVYFLQVVILVCEEVGVKMVIYLDDLLYFIFGLLWVVKNCDDLDWICWVVDLFVNGIMFCIGLIVEDFDNDVYVILVEFMWCK